MTTYADLTWDDPNPLKRWLQRRRIRDAIGLVSRSRRISLIVDFGGGDGVLAEQAARRWPDARVVVFEPYAEFADAARQRLAKIANAVVVEREHDLPTGVDLVFCTEVFEHLPSEETERALWELDRILVEGGIGVIGVPVEIGPVAFFKGLFRRRRRMDAYDADWSRILAAVAGRPKNDRVLEFLGTGRRYHSFHLGFDHRHLRSRLQRWFGPTRITGSPMTLVPALVNSEAYMTFTKSRASR